MSNPQEGRTLLRSLWDVLKRMLRRKAEPGDPYANRMAPVRRGPAGRSGAAVAEPEEYRWAFFRPRKR